MRLLLHSHVGATDNSFPLKPSAIEQLRRNGGPKSKESSQRSALVNVKFKFRFNEQTAIIFLCLALAENMA